VERINSLLGRSRDFEAIKLLVTAGPTHEPIDPVRYITNPSTGKMGYALAQAASERGADVVLVSGPADLPAPAGVETIRVKTAEEMAKAVRQNCDGCRIIIGAAAVSDYTPERFVEQKMKKSATTLTLALKPTVDIMAEMGKRKSNQVLVGFSVETQDVEKNSAEKLKKKNLDLIICNDITQPGAGFATDTNIVAILDTKGGTERLPKLSKLETAHKILDRIHSLL
jgi:phosphopantothenoylcysteine decarboxylase/phosphopantothenate--cysteine ligase